MPSSPRTSKKRSKPRAKPAAIDPSVRDRLVLVLVAGADEAQAVQVATERLKLKATDAKAAVAAAQGAIVAAADVDRRRELAVAKLRLEELIAKAKQAGELKTQLAGMRELSKLLALYDMRATAEAVNATAGETPEARELKAVASHLLPLKLAAADYPLREHARIAADRLRREAA